MRSYVGVTIGPIFDTINDASSPAALWFASNLFSDITRRICKGISEEASFSEVTIYSPYYASDIDLSDGVGKFHDRVIFSAEGFSHEVMEALLETVKSETLELFPEHLAGEEEKAFLREYLQIHYVVKSREQIGEANCVLALSPYLDALELMKSFPKDDSHNPIQQMFAGEKNNRNKYIKDSALFLSAKNGVQLRSKADSIRTIEEIASKDGAVAKGFKRRNYYTVVSADGDAVGQFLKGLSDAEITEFSKACLEYDKAASELIGAYGGMTIYAGGDDLLFLAPVMTEEKNVFGLCSEIKALFTAKIKENETFRNRTTLPTVSFGVSIQYAKYPLYEALEHSRTLLALAKMDGNPDKEDNCRKDNMLIGLQKHSGQSIAVLAANTEYEELKAFLDIGSTLTAEDEMIHSVLYTLDIFASLVSVLNKRVRNEELSLEQYLDAWDNLFDNAGQQKAKAYVREIGTAYYNTLLTKESSISAPVYSLTKKEKEENADMSLRALLYILRLKHFLAEQEGDRR